MTNIADTLAELAFRLSTAADQAARTGALWIMRHRQREDLAELDERLLSDIGKSRAEAQRECAKPFWER